MLNLYTGLGNKGFCGCGDDRSKEHTRDSPKPIPQVKGQQSDQWVKAQMPPYKPRFGYGTGDQRYGVDHQKTDSP